MQIGYLNTKEADAGPRLFLLLGGLTSFVVGLTVALSDTEKVTGFAELACFLGIWLFWLPLILAGNRQPRPPVNVLYKLVGFTFLAWFALVLIVLESNDFLSLGVGILATLCGFVKRGPVGENKSPTESEENQAPGQ